MSDPIKPSYYERDGIDIYWIARMWQLSFPLANAVKYILRAGKKDPAKRIEDLDKAIRSIERERELWHQSSS